MQPAVPEPILVDEFVCAARLSMSVGSLRRDRRKAKVVPFVRVNGLVRYDMDVVRASLRARQEGGKS
jgi:hypothetical protein